MDGRRRIVLLDDDADLRESLSELFELLHAPCLALASLPAMLAAEPEVLACQLAVLDVNLGDGQPSGVDAYQWLRARGFCGRVVFLTGHARSHPAVARAAALGAEVLAKPVDTATLRTLVDGATSS